MTLEKINELERLYKQTTKGPWESETCNSRRKDEAYETLKDPDGKTIADCCNSDLIEIHRDCSDDELGTVHYWDETGRRNLAFIAAAHAAMPELLKLAGSVPHLLKACQIASRTLEIAIRAGLEGFTKRQEDDIVKNHVTMKLLREAIAKVTEAV